MRDIAIGGTRVASHGIEMRSSLALDTCTREHRPLATVDDAAEPDDTLAGLDRVATGTLIDRLLLPQHARLRASLRGLHALAVGLVRADRTRAHVLRQVANMLGELSELVLEQLDHEEHAIFPLLRGGVAPVHVLGALHDHHDDVALRVRRLRALADELPAGCGADGRALVAGLRTLDELARAHRALERQALLTRYA